MMHDYYSARGAMSTGFDRAVRINKESTAGGKALFFVPPEYQLKNDEISSYFDTLALEYRKKTAMVDAVLGFAIAKFP